MSMRFGPGWTGRRFAWNLARCLGIAMILSGAVNTATAATFTVDSTADTFDSLNTTCASPCTLRQAITVANNTAGADAIAFNIAGSGEHVITVLSLLPSIDETLSIDGYTQPGAAANTDPNISNATILIRVHGDPAVGINRNGFGVCAANSSIRGLSVTGFSNSQIRLGGKPDGTACATPATGSAATGNFVGLGTDGLTAIGGGSGISALAGNIQIGGTLPADRNVIGGLSANGVGTNNSASGSVILGNLIGTGRDGVSERGMAFGVGLGQLSSNITVGSVAAPNVIAFNGRGIGTGSAGNNLSWTGNIFSRNIGLAVDLGSNNSVLANDVDDVDTGVNGLQNFPIVSAVTINPTELLINGSLDVGNVSSLSYELSVYLNESCDATGHGDGEQLLAVQSVNLDSTHETFALTVPYTGPTNGRRNVTMLARHPTNGSSEFSACFRLDPTASLVVTSTADTNDGLCNEACTLRDAIAQANQEIGADEIRFAIPGAGPHVFNLGSPLPNLFGPVLIDGYSQAGASPNSSQIANNAVLKLVLNANAAINSMISLTNGSEGSSIRGFSFLHAATVSNSIILNSNSSFSGNWVGVAPNGVTTTAIGGVFVNLQGSSAVIGGPNPADRNVFAQVTGNAIAVSFSSVSNAVIENNVFGLLPDGVTAARNVVSIAALAGGSPTVLIQNNVFGCATTHISGVGSSVISNTFGLSTDGILEPSGTCNAGNLQPRSNAVLSNNVIVARGANGKGIEVNSANSGVVLDHNRILFSSVQDIDLNQDGFSANDPSDADGNANNTQNFPILTQAARNSEAEIRFSGVLNSAPNTRYRIQFFADDTLRRTVSGQTFAFARHSSGDDLEVLTDANGVANFSDHNARFGTTSYVGALSATATRLDLSNNPVETSELSPAIAAFSPGIASLVVTNTDPSGPGSFLQAFLEAEAKPDDSGNPDVISFAIPGTGPFSITPGLQSLVASGRLQIDGLSQDGAQANTSPTGQNALLPIEILNASLQVQASPQVMIRGLVLATTASQAVPFLKVGPNTHLSGNFVGVRSNGTSAAAAIQAAALAFIECIGGCGQIGGSDDADRNLIAVPSSGNLAAILGGTTSASVIENNLFGLRADGVTALVSNGATLSTPSVSTPRALHSRCSAASDQILNNVVASSMVGIRVDSGAAEIQGNSIGARRIGVNTFSFRNGSAGIWLAGGNNHQVHDNLIMNNGGAGIDVGTAVSNSAFYANTLAAQTGIGIDLGSNGVSSNDALDADTGANALQNFPVIASAVRSTAGVSLVGSLASKPSTAYRLRFCAIGTADSSGNGECDQPLADTLDVTTDGSGLASFSIGPITIPSNRTAVTATASELNTGLETTSEFAANVSIRRQSQLNLSSLPAPSVVGQPITVQASIGIEVGGAAATGSVQITSTPNVGSCTISALSSGTGSCAFTPTQTGNITLNASYAGDASTSPSTSSSSHVIEPASSTLLITGDSPDPSSPGTGFTVTFTASSGFATPEGAVTVSASGGGSCNATLAGGQGFCVLTPLGTGNLTLTASYAGSSTHLASGDTESHNVGAAASTTSIQSISPSPSVFGQAITVVAATTATFGTPSGPITISDGAGASCQIASGSGSCQLVPTNVGSDIGIRADFAGSDGHSASFGTASHVVQRAEVQLTLATPFRADAAGGQPVQFAPMRVPVTINAAAPGAGTPTGTIIIESVLGSELCVIVLPATSCDLTPLGFGTTDFTASFVGDLHFNERLEPFTTTIIPSPLFGDSFECEDLCP